MFPGGVSASISTLNFWTWNFAWKMTLTGKSRHQTGPRSWAQPTCHAEIPVYMMHKQKIFIFGRLSTSLDQADDQVLKGCAGDPWSWRNPFPNPCTLAISTSGPWPALILLTPRTSRQSTLVFHPVNVNPLCSGVTPQASAEHRAF